MRNTIRKLEPFIFPLGISNISTILGIPNFRVAGLKCLRVYVTYVYYISVSMSTIFVIRILSGKNFLLRVPRHHDILPSTVTVNLTL